MLAESMPEVTDNGKTYTFKLRKGIYFAPDPIWKGAKRELVAQDVVYSYMRFLDPKNRAPYAFLLEGKIVGLDEHAANAKKSGRFDYDAKIPGIEAVDRYTVRFRLKETDYNFLYIAAHISLGIVAREAIEGYGDDTMGHPVGTGPYMLTSWTRRSKIVLESNPEYRGFTWDFAPSDPASWDDAARQGHARQEDAAGRPRRNHDHRGGAVALARVPAEAARLPQRCRTPSRRPRSMATG